MTKNAMRTLTRKEAFEALVSFTIKMRDLGWPSLPGLLGGMQLIEGAPSDPGVGEDWDEVVALNTPAANPTDVDQLSNEAAYEAVFRFLAHQFQYRRIEKLSEVVDRLNAVPPEPHSHEVADDWKVALP
ncbi:MULTISPECIES: hypothetical protein [Luteibacter]|uniref:hypothetical protein n=1 Tax=Luteibacter TaxID=242605 RepID=UPI0012E0A187|nr:MULTISPECIES: hypothetical protein [unclassified Luteibacter]